MFIRKIVIISLLSFITVKTYSQLKVVPNGNVAIGISYPNHSLHVWGASQCFNYNNKEIQFRPYDQSGSLFHSTIGSNLGNILFWHSAWGYNTLTRGACVSNSDQRIKHDITDLANALSTIKHLNPKKYKFIDSIVPGNKFHYGFLAQSVSEYIPEIVDSTGMYGYLTLNYEEIIPFLVGAVKEQSSTIDSLKTQLQSGSGSRIMNTGMPADSFQNLKNQLIELKKQLDYLQNNCCQKNLDNSKNAAGTDLVISNVDNLLLQNVPNPFDNTTSIKYKIPTSYSGRFYIKIYDLKGEEKQSYEINRTDSQVIVSSNNLVSGMYLYSLIANNDILATKQMIITK